MATSKPASKGSAKQPPKTEARQAPKDAPQKPQDNTAAKQAPKETRKAVNNTFGKVPQNGNDTAAKAPAGGDAKAPAEPKGAPAPDPKAAPAQPGAPVTNDQGQAVKTPDGRNIVLDKNGNTVASDPNTGEIVKDARGNPYMVTPAGNYANADGFNVVYSKNTRNKPVVIDENSGEPIPGGTADRGTPNPRAIHPETGTFFTTPDGKRVVYDVDNGYKLAASDKDLGGKVSRDSDGNPYKILPDGQYAKTAGGNYVAYGKDAGGKDVAVDAATGKTARDAQGNPLALDKDGNFIKTVDGRDVVYNNAGNRTVVDPATGKIATDGSGNPYAIAPDGKYAQTEDGNYVVYDKANGDNMIAIDNKTGQAITDGKQRPLALDENGRYLKTPQGDTVVVDKVNGRFNLVAADKSGELMVIDGKAAAVGRDGNYLVTPDGNRVVYDARGNAVAIGQDGKVITDDDGYQPAISSDGKYIPGAVYDKSTGFRTKLSPDGQIMKGEGGRPLAVDESGSVFVKMDTSKNGPLKLLPSTESGPAKLLAVNDSRGAPVYPVGKTSDGVNLYLDIKTGDLEAMAGGYVYRVDPATNDLAKDASGNYLPPLYDPIKDDPARPPVKPNENVETTFKNLPQGKERGDPMQVRNELFDDYGNLDTDKLVKAAARYDARDIYDAFINASKYGGWDALNTKLQLRPGAEVVHPDEKQSREVITGLLAWQNMNGKYAPLKSGEVPVIVFYEDPNPEGVGGYATDSGTYIRTNLNNDLAGGSAQGIFHELNHSRTSGGFRGIYDGKSRSVELETVTEYLANNWAGTEKQNTGYETRFPDSFQKIEEAVMKMGNGDRNKGLDLLQRAYYTGDPVALRQLKEYLPPTLGVL